MTVASGVASAAARFRAQQGAVERIITRIIIIIIITIIGFENVVRWPFSVWTFSVRGCVGSEVCFGLFGCSRGAANNNKSRALHCYARAH